jgi:hypothetical protein
VKLTSRDTVTHTCLELTQVDAPRERPSRLTRPNRAKPTRAAAPAGNPEEQACRGHERYPYKQSTRAFHLPLVSAPIGVTATVVVAFDRDDEGGEVAVADDLPKLPWASSMPAAVQRSAVSPEDQRFTLRCVRRTISSIDSHGLVDSSVRFRLPLTPSR